jgi:hypothetical protein
LQGIQEDIDKRTNGLSVVRKHRRARRKRAGIEADYGTLSSLRPLIETIYNKVLHVNCFLFAGNITKK